MNNMAEMIKKYKTMIEEIKKYGNYILTVASEEDFDNFNSLLEIENMDLHFECCVDILETELN